MHLFVTIYFFFLETEIDPLAVKLENDDEDDQMQLEADAFMMDGEEEELEEDLKDVMKDLNMLPDKCEVPQPDLLPTVTNDEARDIKKMTVAAQMLKCAGELQTQAMGIINELVEKNPTLTDLQAIIAPAAQTVPNLSTPPTLVSGVSYNPPQTIDLNSIIKPKYIKNMLNDDGSVNVPVSINFSFPCRNWFPRKIDIFSMSGSVDSSLPCRSCFPGKNGVLSMPGGNSACLEVKSGKMLCV